MPKEIAYRHEILRKSIHLSSLWMVFCIGYFPKHVNVALFAFLLGAIALVEYGNYKRWRLFTLTYGTFFNRILREKETQPQFRFSGAPYVLAAALMVAVCFPKVIAMTALSVMLVGDTGAALIGRRFGKHKLNNGTKSVEGSLAFWFFSAGVLLFFYFLYARPVSFLVFGLSGTTAATLAELYENRLHLDDNFSIPLIAGLFLSLADWL